jgi:3-mercaptopropionate dioxygenase
MSKTLEDFVSNITSLVDRQPCEAELIRDAKVQLANLIKTSDWLAPQFKKARADRYAQYLLYKDPEDRFSIVSFVWNTGHQTPIHNHTVWGLVGVLEGAERCEEFTLVNGQPTPTGHSHIMKPGDVEAVFPPNKDWHQVSNALTNGGTTNGVTVSIHLYGADIGKVSRSKLQADGSIGSFISGYDAPGHLNA